MLIRIIISIILVLFVRNKFFKNKTKIKSPKNTNKNDDIVDAEYTVINDD